MQEKNAEKCMFCFNIHVKVFEETLKFMIFIVEDCFEKLKDYLHLSVSRQVSSIILKMVLHSLRKCSEMNHKVHQLTYMC